MDKNAEITKEIILAMINKDFFHRDEWPDTETTVDMVGQAYIKLYNHIQSVYGN